mgnify:CR=1 FL=1
MTPSNVSSQAVGFNYVIIDAIIDAKAAFDKVLKPLGTRDSPARTCKELMKVSKIHLPDGKQVNNSISFYLHDLKKSFLASVSH